MIRSELKRKAPIAKPKPAPGPRKKRCKVCRTAFLPDPPWHAHCSPDCGTALALTLLAKQKAKAQRKERAADKVKLKTRADWLKEAQAAFNKFIRKRDEGKVCCACGEHYSGITHASHYLSVGAHPGLRFNEKNCHGGCVKCNVFLHGNLVNYRANLIKMIGADEVDELESYKHETKMSADEIIGIVREYQLRYKLLNSQE
jgi:hypothetical protein